MSTTPQAREALYAAMSNTFGPTRDEVLLAAAMEGRRMDARVDALKGFSLGPRPKVTDAEQAFWDTVCDDAQVDFEY